MDDYLENRLIGRDLANFKKSLKFDAAFREELDKYRLLREALSDDDSIKFREKLISIDEKLTLEKANKGKVMPIQPKTKKMINWRIAATFIILFGLSSFFWLLNPANENVFEDNYLPYPISDITRGVEANNNIPVKITLDYKNKNYQKTIPFLEKQINQDTKNALLKLYLGNSYLNTSHEKKAISLFNSIEKTNEYYDDAQWFLGLSYLKINKIEKAKIAFKDLTSHPNLYKTKALKILETLD